MADRRSHPRYAVVNSWDGTVQMLRDVVVVRRKDREVTIVCDQPAAANEMMTLDLRAGSDAATLTVRVAESKPVLVGGRVRHEVRLELVGGEVNGAVIDAGAVAVGRL